MKPSLRSIRFKLAIGGVLTVLLPLICIGWLSYSKANQAILELSMDQAHGTAKDLARATFNKLAADKGITVLNIAEDLPFAFKRFCAAEGIDGVEPLSTFRGSFLQDYGVELVDGPLKGVSARAIVVVGDDQVRQVTLYEPGPTRLDRIEFNGGGGTDFSPLLEEADRWGPDIGVFLTDLEGPVAYRPAFPVLWAVPESQANTELPFGRRLVLD